MTTNAAKKTSTTTRTATTGEKSQTSRKEAVALDLLVKAYRTASAGQEVKSQEMLSLKDQRDALRVMQARAAVRVFRHPEVGERYATAAKATGEARTTLRRFIDCGVAFGRSADSDGAPSARELKIVRDAMDSVAEKQAERDRAAKDNAAKVSKVGQSETEGDTEGAKSAAEAALESVEPTFKDVLKQAATLRTVALQFKSTEKLTTKQVDGLEATLKAMLADLRK